MDDASLERACVELVAAAAEIEGGAAAAVRDRVARAAEVLTPALGRQVRAVAVRNAKLFREARLEPEDVVQEVLRRLIESPPRNPEGRDPVVAVLGWARAVASNVALDRRRRMVREVVRPDDGSTDDDGNAPEPIDGERPAEEVLAVLDEITRMHAAAEELATYKYMRETYREILRDPDATALELAQRVGLIELPPGEPLTPDYRARAKKAAQYAWKLRQRMLDLLAARMGHHRRSIVEKGS